MMEGGGIICPITDSSTQKSTKNMFFSGNILYGKLRPYLNKVWKADFDGVCSSEIWVLSSLKLDSDFLYSFCQTPYFKSLANTTCGSKMPRADWNLIGSSLISFPEKTEQKKIGSLMLQLDRKIDIQRKTIEDLENIRYSTEEHAINKFVKSWISLRQAVMLGKMKLMRGNIIPKHSKDDSFIYPVYSSSSQNNGLMGWTNRFMFDQELITWSIDGGGKFFYRQKHKFNVTNVCGILEANTTEFDYRFLTSALLQQWRRNRFDYQSKAHPSVIETIYKIPVVSKEKQVLCSRLFKDIDYLIEKEGEQLSELIKLKKYLLSNLFI